MRFQFRRQALSRSPPQSALGCGLLSMRFPRPQHASSTAACMARALGLCSVPAARPRVGFGYPARRHRRRQRLADQSASPIAIHDSAPDTQHPLVCLYPPSPLRKRSVPFPMATKKERHPSTLTLADNAALQKSPIGGHSWHVDSGNSPGSLPPGLPAPLPYGLPEPAKMTRTRKPARVFPAPGRPMAAVARPAQPGTFLRQPRPIPASLGVGLGPLGIPLNITEVSRLIGCSPWSVRQTLIPRGLPHFRFKANGRLIFYRDQVVRWIEKNQGGQTTK